MTQEQIREAITEMDCLDRKEANALAGLIFEAMETGAKEKIQAAAAVIKFLASADRITLTNRLDMLDLFI